MKKLILIYILSFAANAAFMTLFTVIVMKVKKTETINDAKLAQLISVIAITCFVIAGLMTMIYHLKQKMKIKIKEIEQKQTELHQLITYTLANERNDEE